MEQAASFFAPSLDLHVHLGFRADGALAWSRFATAALPDAELPDEPRAVVEAVARHLRTGQEDLSGVRVALDGCSAFQRRALDAIRRIPPGRTMTYGEVARALDMGAAAARAVGGAMAANPIPLVVPCHRVVPADGAPFRNYSGFGGVATKLKLLRLEGASVQQDLGRFS